MGAEGCLGREKGMRAAAARGFLVCFADEQRLRGSSLRGEIAGARACGLPGAQRTHRIDREKQQQRALRPELPAPGATAHHPEEHARRGARDS